MLTPLQCAQLSAEVYDTPASSWDHHWDVDGVVLAHRRIAGQDALVFRGSATVEDWVRDFIAVPVVDLEVGLVHAGFLAGLDDLLLQVQGALRGPFVITGHSLGGARARISAAKLMGRGFSVAQVCVFGSPKPGFGRLASIFAGRPCVHQSFRHGEDPVPNLPFGPLWRHTEPWQALPDVSPAKDLADDLLDHRVFNYVQGLTSDQA